MPELTLEMYRTRLFMKQRRSIKRFKRINRRGAVLAGQMSGHPACRDLPWLHVSG
jgi:hypothetical protein